MSDRAWSYDDIASLIFDAMEAAGIPPAAGRAERLVLDGSKHRYRISGDKAGSKNGEYCAHMDGTPAGYVLSYSAKHGEVCRKWNAFGGEEVSPEERDAYRAQMEKIREAKRAVDEDKRGQAMVRARDIWETATPYDIGDTACTAKNDYPIAKGLSHAHGARLMGRSLVLAVRDTRPASDGSDGLIMSLQEIYRDDDGRWQKRFTKGAPVRGGSIRLPREPRTPSLEQEVFKGSDISREIVFVCEGWATGATIAEATGCEVWCAMNAGNLQTVTEEVRRRRPECEVILCPDNDKKTAGNPGMTAAVSISDELGCYFVTVVFGDGERGTDWNDYAAIHGIDAVRREISMRCVAAMMGVSASTRRREKLFVHTTRTGVPRKTLENLVALMAWEGITVGYNVISKNIEFVAPGASFGGDNDLACFDGYMTSKCCEHGLAETTWKEYRSTISARNVINPVREWITSREWDRRDRMQAIFDTIETPASYPERLKRLLMKKWLISAVAAAMHDGSFQCRGVLTLQGAQSIGKTSWFRALIPPEQRDKWFGEGLSLMADNKDSIKLAICHWITELGELEATFRKSDMNRLKAFVTSPYDKLRLPYAAVESTFQRRTVFAATVNDKRFLVDDTGNTRWWCVEAVSIDYRHKIDTQQLFAQIYETLYLDEDFWLSPEEERALEEQNAVYRTMSMEEDLLNSRLNWLEPRAMWTYRTTTDILIQCGMTNPTHASVIRAAKYLQKRCGDSVKAKGHDKKTLYLAPSEARPQPAVKYVKDIEQ